MVRQSKEKQFWLINTSVDRDVSISDLRITIKRGQRLNLLSKGYSFTEKQLNDSLKSGSIYKKRHILVVREVNPKLFKKKMVKEVAKPNILVPLRNPEVTITPPYMEELEIKEGDEFIKSDEQFAAEQAEMDDMDRAPALAVDKKFKKNQLEDTINNDD